MEDHAHHQQPENTDHREYFKLAVLIIILLVATTWLSTTRGLTPARWFADFMGLFFLTFGVFKLANLPVFAGGYRDYDLIAARLPLWGYLYPFVELGLGAVFLLSRDPLYAHLVTLVLMSIGALGVYRTIRAKNRIQCLCLGNVIKLPLSKVSLTEDVTMLLMAAAMLSLR